MAVVTEYLYQLIAKQVEDRDALHLTNQEQHMTLLNFNLHRELKGKGG